MPGPADELIRWAARNGGPATDTDRDLLARFAAGGDGAAFAELVRRHGPTVFGVCRRVVGHRQDAEDAFQATFLVLARKSDRVGRPEALGGWLYGVAVRVARKARKAAERRRRRETPTDPLPETPIGDGGRDSELAGILDEELAALPAWYRDAVLLCDLRGKSRAEAAGELGIPEGTLSSRLNAGRKKLAVRLTRRGLGVPAAGLAALANDVTAVPPKLAVAAVEAAVGGPAGVAISTNIQYLAAEGVWPVGKAKLLAAAVIAAGVGVGTVTGWQGEKPAEPTKEAKAEPTKAESPKPVPDTKPAPEAKPAEKMRLLLTIDKLGNVSEPVWSPDGRLVAVSGRTSCVLDAKTGEIRFKFPPSILINFLADSRTYATFMDSPNQLQFWDLTAAAGAGPARKLDYDDPKIGYPFAVLPDGKAVAFKTMERPNPPRKPEDYMYLPSTFSLMDVATGAVTKIGDDEGGFLEAADFAPGGRITTLRTRAGAAVVEAWDQTTGKALWTRKFETDPMTTRFFIQYPLIRSPDGKRLIANPLNTWRTRKLQAPPGGGPLLPRPLPRPVVEVAPKPFSRDVLAFDPLTGEDVPFTLENAGKMLTTIQGFSHDGRLVAGKAYDDPVSYGTYIWDATTGKVLHEWPMKTLATAFSPTAPILAVLEDVDDPDAAPKSPPTGSKRPERRPQKTVIGLWDVSSLAK